MIKGINETEGLSRPAKDAAINLLEHKQFNVEITTRQGVPPVGQHLLDHFVDMTRMPTGSITNSPLKLPKGGYLPEGASVRNPVLPLLKAQE
jgi:hypothetical protein